MEITWKIINGEGEEEEEMREKVQGISSINGRYKIDRGGLSCLLYTSDAADECVNV